jgi:hypothetical protein|tara:strand:- start:2823 stop:3599 length:777 start_codon:yes stop_codon:yes gene_type:complete
MSKKPLPRKKRVVNRGYQYSRKKEDRVKNISVTLKDIDSAVIYYIENVIQPSVEENGENVKVPIMYSSLERWKAIKRDGFLRDKKRQIITPLIMFKRNTIDVNKDMPIDKLDANNPHMFYTFEKKYSKQNIYDRLDAQIGVISQRQYYNVSVPDYVNLNYSFTIWTSYIKQMNSLIEKFTYSDGAYWGNPDKMRFKSIIDSFDDATEIGDTERLVRTTFNLTLKGYLLSEEGNDKKPTTNKFITPQKVTFSESLVDEV